MVSNDILEYVSTGEFHNIYTNGYGVEVNRERKKVQFYNKVDMRFKRQTCLMG